MLPRTRVRLNCSNAAPVHSAIRSRIRMARDERRPGCLGSSRVPRYQPVGSVEMKHVTATPDLPRFDVLINPPDLRPWLANNREIPGVITRDSGRTGPHVVLLSL